ncbi:hypothetical protein GCM10017744_092540 [Streptomyces antimycoticus]
MTARLPRPARLRPADLLRLGLLGPRTRRLRSALSALGIALGIAAVVAVTGISASNQAHLLDRLDRLGSNLITVSPGEDFEGKKVPLPKESVTMLGNIAPVERVSATGNTKANVYRNEFVPSNQTNSLRVLSARLDLLKAVRGEVRTGRWLDHATERLPVVVLGSSSAERLGVTAPGTKVWIAGEGLTGEWYGVLGILEPNELVPEIDDSVLVGGPTAIASLDGDRTPSTVYLRVHPDRVSDVQDVAAATANPAQPGMVAVSRPSDLLKARAETDDTLTGLVLSLAGWPCSSEGWASPTPWWSASWNGGERWGCGGRWGRAGDRSRHSSSSRRCSWGCSAGWSVPLSGPRRSTRTRPGRGGPPQYRWSGRSRGPRWPWS